MALKDLDPNKKVSYIKGGRKVGIYNGDIATGTYIDINGNFINKDGFAINEEGYILFNKDGKPICGSTPSFIPIEEYQPLTNPWLSEYEKRKLESKVVKDPGGIGNELLLKCYFDIFNIKVDIPDELLLSPKGFISCWKHYMHSCKTVQVSWADVFRTGDI